MTKKAKTGKAPPEKIRDLLQQTRRNLRRDLALKQADVRDLDKLLRRARAIRGKGWVCVSKIRTCWHKGAGGMKLTLGKLYLIRRVTSLFREKGPPGRFEYEPILAEWRNAGWHPMTGSLTTTHGTIEVWM